MAVLHKIGIDLGGTKIAAILFDPQDNVIAETRVRAPRNNYTKTIECIAETVAGLEKDLEQKPSVGIGMPGSISPASGLVQNSNSVWLNNMPFHQDLTSALGCEIRMENDANCFALSEALHGAGRHSHTVFGVIIGTGCGGGLVFDKKLNSGPHAIGGEWGHNPLPWPTLEELGAVECWCGQKGCLECWISGTGLTNDHARVTGERLDAEDIARHAQDGDRAASATLERYLSRLARSLAAITNIIDPDAIVLGGGLSNIDTIYDRLPGLMQPYIFADHFKPNILRPKFGDASGVRGAAHLWP